MTSPDWFVDSELSRELRQRLAEELPRDESIDDGEPLTCLIGHDGSWAEVYPAREDGSRQRAWLDTPAGPTWNLPEATPPQ